MKKFVLNLLLVTLFFAFIGIGSEVIWHRSITENSNGRNIAVNRINNAISQILTETGEYAE